MSNKPMIVPQNMGELMKFSEMVSRSDLVPKDYRGKPQNIMVAVQWGHEIGLSPLQALQNISVINGRPSVWGDSALALVQGSGLLEDIQEYNENGTAYCTVKRRGQSKQTRTFSLDDAKKAGLLNKQGPWKQYTNRMLQMRARGFALRDVFPDVLKGVITAEEAQDIPEDKPLPPTTNPKPQAEVIDAEFTEEPEEPKATKEQKEDLGTLCKDLGWSGRQLEAYLKRNGAAWKTLTREQADRFMGDLGVILAEKQKPSPFEPKTEGQTNRIYELKEGLCMTEEALENTAQQQCGCTVGKMDQARADKLITYLKQLADLDNIPTGYLAPHKEATMETVEAAVK